MPDNLIRNHYLSAMGIDVWVSRDTIEIESVPVDNDTITQQWEQLENSVTQCQQCEVFKSRKYTGFGNGNKNADLFIIGTMTNDNDDTTEEFSGSEKLLLDNMLSVLNLTRKNIYTSNIIKCKSQQYRQFSNSEMENCLTYLERQIALVKPKILLIFGEQVAQFILKTDKSIAKLSDEVHDYLNATMVAVVIAHPEQLLLSAESKKQAWSGLLKISSILGKK